MTEAERTIQYRGFTVRAWRTGKRSATDGWYVVTNPRVMAPDIPVILGSVKVADRPELESLRATIEAAKAAIDRLLLKDHTP